jgi:hypothetical protein
VLVLIVANGVDLSSIASVGSATALLTFLLVGIAGYLRRAETGSSGPVVALAIGVTTVVLGFFAVDTARNAPETFVAIVAILLLSVVLQLWTEHTVRGRDMPEEPSVTAAG